MTDAPEERPAPTTSVAARTARLRHSLTAEARRLTAEHGLGGFTLDQLCAGVGVSRRTFFNHFASKDDVVVGRALDDDDELLDAWAAGRPPVGAAPLGTVLDDLARLAAAHLAQIGLTRGQAADFRAALEREPRLLGEVMRLGDAQKERFTAAVARREGLAVDDPRLDTVVTVGTALLGRAIEQYLADDDADPVDVVVGRHLAVLRELFGAGASPPTPATTTETETETATGTTAAAAAPTDTTTTAAPEGTTPRP